MSWIDDFKQEVKEVLPELRDVVKKELKDQVAKRVNEGAGASNTTPKSSAQVMGIDPKILMIGGAALIAFLIFKRR